MDTKSISMRIDTKLIEKIDVYATSRYMSRTKAIISMLENTQVIVIEEAGELLRLLGSLERILRQRNLDYYEKEQIRKVCESVWQLLSLITEKCQRQIEK